MANNVLELETEDVPLEYQLFALAFREPGAITKFAEELPAELVGLIHGDSGINEFYKAFLHFYDKTGLDPIDPIAWKAWLQTESDIISALGGIGPVNYFVDTVMGLELSDPESVVKVLKHRAFQRKQMNNLQDLQNLLVKKGQKSEEDQKRILDLTEQIRSLESNLDYNPLDFVLTAYDIADHADELMESPEFLPTPFKSYNRALSYTDSGGYFRGAVRAIVAKSGGGKSTLAKCLANHWLDLGNSVLFVNYEEAPLHWERILMTQIVGQNVYKKASVWGDKEKAKYYRIFKDKLEEWGDRLMVRHDPDTAYFDDLEIWLRDIMGHNARIPDVVIIDTIQSMFIKGSGGARWQEFEKMMVRLEKLAKDMNSVFIITAQQNLNATKEKREVIEQQDIGGSVSIVQKCSVITVITDKKLVSQDESDDDYLMQLQIPKNRITGSTFSYDPPLILYNDDIKSYVEFDQVDDSRYTEFDELEEEEVFGPGEDFY